MREALAAADHAFRVDRDWLRLPDAIVLGEVTSVAADGADRLYLFNRGPNPMIVADIDGRVLDVWGHGLFTRPHGVDVAPDGRVFCTDYGDHTVRVFTADGRLTMTLGERGRPAPFLGGAPFNQCAHSTVGPDGAIFVADGYGNARVHKFAPDGRLLLSWGEPGTDEGQFIIPHSIGCDGDGMIHVADRENHRIQIFDADGRFAAQWPCYRPLGLFVSRTEDLVIVGEDCPSRQAPAGWRNVGSRLVFATRRGRRLAVLGGGGPGCEGSAFIAPHGLAVTSSGRIVVADLATSTWPRFFTAPVPKNLSTVHRVSIDSGRAGAV